jgi:tight adherence protein B
MGSPWLFLGLVFFAVFLLVQGMVVPVFGESTRMRKRVLSRLTAVTAGGGQTDFASLLRQKYLRELSPLERALETLPGMERLARLIEQSGKTTPAYRVLMLSVLLAVVGAFCAWTYTRVPHWSLLVALGIFSLPYLKILRDRGARLARFEEQLPDALDVVKRALKAGHPFSQALKLVAEDMDDPIAHEFDLVFSEINYGGDVRTALLGLLERIPSVSVMAFVTAVLVQKETGGNLAETFERITAVIRGRFKLHRRVRTLSAEGRLSAWILALVPLVLFGVISLTTPDYLPMLLKDPMGKNLIAIALVLGVLGILWIRRIIRIQV